MEHAKRILRIVLISGKHKPATVSEVAQALKVSDSLIYQWCDMFSGKKPTQEQVLFLSQYFITEHSDTRLAHLFVPEGWEIVQTGTGQVNGMVDDEISETVEDIGQARTLFNTGEFEQGEAFVDKAMNTLARMKEEFKAKEDI